MDRRDFFYKQRVTEAEMDSAFSDAENSLWNARIDANVVGVITGLVPSLGSSPTVDITKGVALSSLGKRIVGYTDGASTKNFSYATATDGSATSVTGGQERWISIFAAFGRQALDPRTDGNGDPVYFNQPECLHDGTTSGLGGSGVDKFYIVKGASAGTGTAVKPSLVAGAVLVCDILRTPSDASNVLSTARRQVYGVADSTAPGTGNGLALIMSAMTTWLGGRTNPAQASLHAAIDKIITDLAATTASDDGAERIGANGTGGNLTNGSVRSQLDALEAAKANLAGANHFTGTQTIDGGATIGLDLGVTGNETVGGTLGVTGVATHSTRTRVTGTATVPAIDAATVAEDVRILLFEANFTRSSRTDSKLRIYLNNKKLGTNHPTRSLLITSNAAWNGSQWVADGSDLFAAVNDICFAVEIGGSRVADAISQHVYLPSIILYRAISNPIGAAFNDSAWLGNALDIGRPFTTQGNGVQTTVDDTQTGIQRGVNYLNPINGEFRIGSAGVNGDWAQRIHFGIKDVAAAGGEVHGGVISFPNSYTASPSSATINTVGGATNLGAFTVAVGDHRYATYQATSVAAGAIAAIANVDVGL